MNLTGVTRMTFGAPRHCTCRSLGTREPDFPKRSLPRKCAARCARWEMSPPEVPDSCHSIRTEARRAFAPLPPKPRNSCRPPSEQLKFLGAKQRDVLAQSCKCREFLFLRSLRKTFGVPIHQALQMPVRLLREAKVTDRFDPRCRSRNGHRRGCKMPGMACLVNARQSCSRLQPGRNRI